MKNAVAISAQLVDIRNVGHNKSVKLTLHVPAEQAGMVMEAFGWPTAVDPVPVALARLVQPAGKEVVPDTNSKSTSTDTQPASGDVPTRAPRNKLAQLAGMLGKEQLFHKYIETNNEEDAAEFIRNYCSVESRSQIRPDTLAAKRFLKLYDEFKLWRDADAFVEAS
jgi:hypothetical protein